MRTLSSETIRIRLAYYDAESIDRIRDYLDSSVIAEISRADAIDRKASIVIGFAAAIVGLVIPWVSPGEAMAHGYFFACVAVSALAALLGIPFAFFAYAAQRGWARLHILDMFRKVTPARTDARIGFSVP